MTKPWKTGTLGDMCEMYQPKTISIKETTDDGPFPVYGANGVIGRYHTFNHEDPQLLITCRGATCGSVNMSEARSWITGNAMVVRPKNGAIDLRFLEYMFRGGLDISKAITGAAQPQITRTSLSPIQVSYPEPPEQQRIVDFLDKAFENIATAKANTEKNIENARALFDCDLRETFRESKAGWTEGAFGDFFRVRSGDFLPNKQMNRLGTVPVYGGNGLTGTHDHSNVSGQNIIIGRVGAKCGNVHVVSGPAWVTDNALYISSFGVPVHHAFLAHLLASKHLRQTAREAAQPVISYSTIKDVRLAFPSTVSEQKIIADRLDAVRKSSLDLQATYEAKLVSLERLTKSILRAAFNGQL